MNDATARRLSRLHSVLFRSTGGRIGRRFVRNDMLLLTTRGRLSGRFHTRPLLYLRDGGSFVVIASWGGRDYHPDWYTNLVNQPEAQVQVGRTTLAVRARVAEGSERDRWWDQAVQAYDGYARYQRRTARSVPILVLEPLGG